MKEPIWCCNQQKTMAKDGPLFRRWGGGGGGQFLGPRLSESVLDTNASVLGQGQ